MSDIIFNDIVAEAELNKFAQAMDISSEDMAVLYKFASIAANTVTDDDIFDAAFEGADKFFKTAGISEKDQAVAWSVMLFDAGLTPDSDAIQFLQKEAAALAPNAEAEDVADDAAQQAAAQEAEAQAIADNTAAAQDAQRLSPLYGENHGIISHANKYMPLVGYGALAAALYGGLFGRRETADGKPRGFIRRMLGPAALVGGLGTLGGIAYQGYKGRSDFDKNVSEVDDRYQFPNTRAIGEKTWLSPTNISDIKSNLGAGYNKTTEAIEAGVNKAMESRAMQGLRSAFGYEGERLAQ